MSFSTARSDSERLKRKRMKRDTRSSERTPNSFYKKEPKYLTYEDLTDNQKSRLRDALIDALKNGIQHIRQVYNALVGRLTEMIQGKRLEANHLVLGIRNGKHTKQYALTLEDFQTLCSA